MLVLTTLQQTLSLQCHYSFGGKILRDRYSWRRRRGGNGVVWGDGKVKQFGGKLPLHLPP